MTLRWVIFRWIIPRYKIIRKQITLRWVRRWGKPVLLGWVMILLQVRHIRFKICCRFGNRIRRRSGSFLVLTFVRVILLFLVVGRKLVILLRWFRQRLLLRWALTLKCRNSVIFVSVKPFLICVVVRRLRRLMGGLILGSVLSLKVVFRRFPLRACFRRRRVIVKFRHVMVFLWNLFMLIGSKLR